MLTDCVINTKIKYYVSHFVRNSWAKNINLRSADDVELENEVILFSSSGEPVNSSCSHSIVFCLRGVVGKVHENVNRF